jgi:hypothetical protein
MPLRKNLFLPMALNNFFNNDAIKRPARHNFGLAGLFFLIPFKVFYRSNQNSEVKS